MKWNKFIQTELCLCVTMILILGSHLHVIAQDGQLDFDFAQNGKIVTDILGEGRDITIQEDGKIVVVGHDENDMVVLRYHWNGEPDLSFNSTGRQTIDFFGKEDKAYAVDIASDGKILIGGHATKDSQTDFAMASLRPDGTLNPAFNVGIGGGLSNLDVFGQNDGIFDLLIQPDDKILVAGFTYNPNSEQERDFAVARFYPDGSSDLTFGSDGVITMDISHDGELDVSLLLQLDGKFLVGGTVITNGFEYDIVVYRFHPNGLPDLSFNFDGKVFIDAGASGGGSLALLDNGDILVGGSGGFDINISDEGLDFLVAKFDASGNFVLDFGTEGGYTLEELGSNVWDWGYDILVQPDDKIMIGGYTQSNPNNFALARFDEGGLIDPYFWDNGIRYIDFDVDLHSNDRSYAMDARYCYDAAVETLDGRMIMTGASDGKIALCATKLGIGLPELDCLPSSTQEATTEYVELQQNQPNPFSRYTQINYDLKTAAFVQLKVYDVLGKEVHTLVAERQGTGSYTVDFDARAAYLSKGLYFYSLDVEGKRVTRRMILN